MSTINRLENAKTFEYAKARNVAKAETCRAIQEYETAVAKQAKKNPKAFFRYVNGKLNK